MFGAVTKADTDVSIYVSRATCYAECLEHRSSQSEGMGQIAMRMRQKLMPLSQARRQSPDRPRVPESQRSLVNMERQSSNSLRVRPETS